MKQRKRWLAGLLCAALAACLLPTAALAAEGDSAQSETVVTTSDEFRAALKDETIETIRFSGKITVSQKEGESDNLYAGTKTIRPEHPDTDEDNLIFAPGITMLHISMHEGNTQNADTQSLRQIYGRNYVEDGPCDMALFVQGAQAVVGWYEYHKGTEGENETVTFNREASIFNYGQTLTVPANHRVCYALYCGEKETAVDVAAQLSGDSPTWFHTPTEGGEDKNQLVFLQFGRSGDVTIDKNIKVCNLFALDGQNLTVAQGATLTAANINLGDIKNEAAFAASGCDLTVKDGGTVKLSAEAAYFQEGNNPQAGMLSLYAEGRIAVENLETGLMIDTDTDTDVNVWCEYNPLLFSGTEVETEDGPKGRFGDWSAGTDTLSMPQGDTRDGYLYSLGFFYDGDSKKVGWHCYRPDSVVADPSTGLTIGAGEDGKTRFTAADSGTYRVYVLGGSEDETPEPEGLPLTVTVTAPVNTGSSGGGSSGGGSSSSTTTSTTTNPDGSTTTKTENRTTGTVTETTRNSDGSTTVVETRKDGTVTTTETDKEGNKSETVAKADGSSVTKAARKDGTTATSTTGTDGKTEAEVSLSGKAVSDARERGAAVTVPIPAVTAAADRAAAPVVEIAIPGGSGEVKVEIPVKNVVPGAVAVIVNADGTETVARKSAVTGEGVALTLESGATVKIVDNTKTFTDVDPAAWHSSAVDFVSARDIFNGTGGGAFTPNGEMTRGMVAQVLHNLENNPEHILDGNFRDVNPGAWYAGAVTWAAELGIVNGYGNGVFGAGDNVTREQFAAMLWRYAGSPASSGQELRFTDADKASGYAQEALLWAVEKGILSGKGNGVLDPGGQATRAQVAQMLMRFLNHR